MSARTLAVVSAGLRQPSSTRLLADRLAAATVSELSARGHSVTSEAIELRDHAHDITNHLLTGFPSPSLRTVIEAVVNADGLIAVSPVFTASFSGLFNSFADVLEDGSLAGKPVLIAATGGSARHSLALEFAMRPLMAYMRAITMPPRSTPPPRTGPAPMTPAPRWAIGSGARRANWPRRWRGGRPNRSSTRSL